MKHLLLLVTLVAYLLGNHNPGLYSSLGNKLFNASDKLNKLENIDNLRNKIEKYQAESNLVLTYGLDIESNGNFTATEKKKYLDLLRSLEKSYKNIIRSVRQELLSSIENNNHSLFVHISKSSLTDIYDDKALEKKVISYNNKNEQTTTLSKFDFHVQQYKSLKGRKSFALAFDENQGWAIGYAAKYHAQELADKAAMRLCNNNRMKQNVKKKCTLYMKGNHLLEK